MDAKTWDLFTLLGGLVKVLYLILGIQDPLDTFPNIGEVLEDKCQVSGLPFVTSRS